MLEFSKFITEAKTAAETTAKRTHLEPPGFLAFDGHEGVAQADAHLREFHKHLLGKKSNVDVSTKIDGAPAIHVGMDKDGSHFVATKGVFNKTPKLYKTHQDIDKDYEPDHPLNHILKQSLDHLPKTLPRDMKPGEMYKGDIISTAGNDRSPKKEKGFITTTPNVIKYKFPEQSQEGKELKDSKVGVVWHTKFDKNGQAGAISPKDRSKFARSKEVFSFDPSVKANPENYTPEEQHAFENHMENVRQEYSKVKPDTYDRLAGHNETLRSYMNGTFRSGEQPSFDGYTQHLSNKQKKDVDSVKTPAAKERKIQQHSAFIKQAHENRKDVEKLLNLHNHLENAKNILVGVADKNSVTTNELPNGEATSHEGYVTNDKKGNAVKHVDPDFRRNVLTGMGAIGKAKAQPVAESLNEADAKHLVISHVRMNPIHAGHQEVVDAVTNTAKKLGAEHRIVLSHSHDSNKNPLSPAQKLKHARRAFPGVNFQNSSPEHPNLLHHLSKAYDEGHREVTIVGGSDRDTYHDLAQKYNGQQSKHGYYNMKINFKQAGATRADDDQGVAGYSASKMRAAAAKGDTEGFKKMAPAGMSDKHKEDMFNDTRKGLKLNENTVSAIGGLGFNTGNPAAVSSYIANYVNGNTIDTDQRNNILKAWIQKNHAGHHALKFNDFDPKKD